MLRCSLNNSLLRPGRSALGHGICSAGFAGSCSLQSHISLAHIPNIPPSSINRILNTYLLPWLPLHIPNHLLGFPNNRINHFLRLRARLLDCCGRRSRASGFGFGDAASGYFGAARLGGVGCGFLVGCERGLDGGNDAGLGVAWWCVLVGAVREVWWCGGVVEGARDYVCIPPRFARGVNGDKG
jgi:hypothetical protein